MKNEKLQKIKIKTNIVIKLLLVNFGDKGPVVLSLWFFITSFVTSQRHTRYD